MKTRTARDTAAELEMLHATLSATQERLARITQEISPLLAEGTKVTAPTAQPTANEVGAAIEAALRERPRTDVELARVAGSPQLARVAVTRLRRTGRLYNLASAAHPRWQLVLGPKAPSAERYAAILRLVSERPYTLAELEAAIGCTRGQASGALVQMHREGRPLKNLGTGRQGLWYLSPVEKNGPRRKHT